jgi:predicted dehydrogenase
MQRRRWLQTIGVGAIGFPAVVRGQNLNSRVQLAAVGTEGKGWSDFTSMRTHAQVDIVGVCDVDRARMERARHEHKEARWFQDSRRMFAEMEGKIDGVTVSTADHMHAFITLDALRRGIHVHCQKPLTHNIWEARQVRQQAGKSGVITRMGNQIHSHEFYRTGTKWIQDGQIGKVKEVHSWCNATGHGKSYHISRPSEMPLPETLDWDVWLGVAPFRPYAGGHRVYHPWGWRDWQDFGNGALGDFGCHILDPVFTALNIDQAPLTVQCSDHTGMNDEVWPAQSVVHYTFPAFPSTTGPQFKVTWYDGGRLPGTKGGDLPPNEALPSSGSLFIGETGSLVQPHVGAPRLYRKGTQVTEEPEKLPGLDHYHGWVDGIISGKQPSDGFDYAGPLTEVVLLGNIAVRFRGQTLEWDSANLRIKNLEEANPWVRREYRKGWEIAAVG